MSIWSQHSLDRLEMVRESVPTPVIENVRRAFSPGPTDCMHAPGSPGMCRAFFTSQNNETAATLMSQTNPEGPVGVM